MRSEVMENNTKYILLAIVVVIVIASFSASILLRKYQRQFLRTGDRSYEKNIRTITVLMSGIFLVLILLTIYLIKKF